MRFRPLPVSVATILIVLVSLTDFPFPWSYLMPEGEGPPDFVIYAGIVLGIVGLAVAVGLWMMARWSFWATIVVAVLNLLLGAPGVVEAPTAALRVTIAVTEVMAALVIVLLMLPVSRHAVQGVASSGNTPR